MFRMVEYGAGHGIRPGEFFGPVSAAYCLREAVQLAIEAKQIADILRIYISQDAISKWIEGCLSRIEYTRHVFLVYRQDVINLCMNKSSHPIRTDGLYPSIDSLTNESNAMNWSTSVLILVPLRLGLNELDLVYEDYLKEALKLPQTVGIIGGSPRHAVYIVGFQDDSFIDLDPHFCQTTVNVLENTFDLTVR
jgi:cysteine protease ATG4